VTGEGSPIGIGAMRTLTSNGFVVDAGGSGMTIAAVDSETGNATTVDYLDRPSEVIAAA
jgi:hypothetical protein